MNDIESIEKIHAIYESLTAQAGKIIVGQNRVMEELVIALLAGGHCLLEGVPGLGKTLMVRTLADTLALEFQRIQCTPDLMPGDITGSEMFSTGNLNDIPSSPDAPRDGRCDGRNDGLRFVPGPVFTNILLADEINRTPPRTQSALLEAMQEHQVTVGRTRRALPEPFFVLATQNPIEQEGTYPLPEAQLDRFMFKSRVEYPSRQEELDILLRTTGEVSTAVTPVLTREELLNAMSLVRRVPVSGPVAEYALEICRATRPASEKEGSSGSELQKYVTQYVSWGGGPRAGQALLLGGRARAILHGRLCVERGDITALAPSVLRHRIQLRFSAEAAGITCDDVVQKIIEQILCKTC